MKRGFLSLAVAAGLAMALPAAAQPAAAPPDLAAREDRLVGAQAGRLRLDEAGLAFDSDGADDRRWTYDQLRQVRIETSHRLVVETYRSRGWKGFGASQTLTYRTDQAIPAGWVAWLSSRSAKPIVTAVQPPRPSPARFEVAVNHEGTDTAGVLRLYDDGLAFETDRDGYGRFWRLADLDRVLRQDRYRIAVAAYEGPREHVRPFLFTLKGPLPAGFYDEIWRMLNGRTTGD